MRTVLDAEAVQALLAHSHRAHRKVRARLEIGRRLGAAAVVPTVALAELYRGRDRSGALDALLARERRALVLRDTDRALARLVGGVLQAAGAGSEDLVDAHAIAVAAEDDRAVVLTGDPGDLERLAAPYPGVTVVALS